MNRSESNYPVITLDGITVRLRDRLVLPDTTWTIRAGENWAVVGPNGSGKSTLVRALAGRIPVVQGRIIRHTDDAAIQRIGFVSVDQHRQVMAAEDLQDHCRYFSGDIHMATPVRQLIDPDSRRTGEFSEHVQWAVGMLEVGHLLDRGVRDLSTGEMRKVLIAKELARKPGLIILDEPFNGLDITSRKHLGDILVRLMNHGVQLILVAHRIGDILPSISRMVSLSDCRVTAMGSRDKVLRLSQIPPVRRRTISPSPEKLTAAEVSGRCPSPAGPDILIRMNDVQVDYGPIKALTSINWTVRYGENWAVSGPNGSGKSTLLRLISGDHPQAYCNDIWVFGTRRGSGESIWDIKHRIGMISSEFHIRYRKRIRSIDVVYSGFFDSVGLYRTCSDQQKQTARDWIERLGISELADRWFDRLSFGEQRMILLARAMVKSPLMLVLDEPFQGLDTENRQYVSKLIDIIGRETSTHILLVTHHAEDIPACINSVLELVPSPLGGYTSKIDGFVKRPVSALRGIPRHCGIR